MKSSARTIESLGADRSHALHRSLHHDYPIAVGGKGAWLFDARGRRYLDGSGGAAVSSLGHGHPRLIDAVREQAARLAFAHTAFFTNEPMERLAARLAAAAPGDLERVLFVSGGSEAVEAAVKLALQYHAEHGEPARTHVIARRRSYHGATLRALALGDSLWRQEPFRPALARIAHVAPCYAYREQQTEESDAEYAARAAASLEAEILAIGPERVAAFIAEPVVGATAGAVPPVADYLQRVREICDRHGVLLILDEVMCGMGRTGSLFACEQEGVIPDLMTLGKGLGAGYQPIGALMVRESLYRVIAEGSGSFRHGHTYMGHPVACAAGNAVLDVIEEDKLLPRVRWAGERLRQLLEECFASHPHVGDIRGRGLLIGIELVENRADKTPFAPERAVHRQVMRAGMAEGLICYPAGGTIDGRRGDHILLAPPFIVSDDEIEELVQRLVRTLDRVFLAPRQKAG
ncbi:MAG: aspartate aminotransferase family protein [Alphaproteobacteria bacterium]|nr:MAG: aspartate aminotransferase family protein [Alphaproteobacteria bacterium]